MDGLDVLAKSVAMCDSRLEKRRELLEHLLERFVLNEALRDRYGLALKRAGHHYEMSSFQIWLERAGACGLRSLTFDQLLNLARNPSAQSNLHDWLSRNPTHWDITWSRLAVPPLRWQAA
ncbi:MAG: hypothetical protein JWM56_1187 [Candidatus Peribacteria bacterium]|nr:hypothetical protein [Candidatus Peribacteria bacterium]